MDNFKKIIKISLLILFGFIVLPLFAQSDDKNYSQNNANNMEKVGADIQNTLKIFSEVQVLRVSRQGVPSFIKGKLGRVEVRTKDITEMTMRAHLSTIAPIFRLKENELKFRKMRLDDKGNAHIRYKQVKNGLDVIGGELILHINDQGMIFAVNGTAYGDTNVSSTPTITSEEAVKKALSIRQIENVSNELPRLVYIISRKDHSMHLVYEVIIEGSEKDQTPIRDRIYIDANNGELIDIHPEIINLINREIYSANNSSDTSKLPGTLIRKEYDNNSSTDSVVNQNYDLFGKVYNYYYQALARDSFDRYGKTIKSSVHFDINYVNAFWSTSKLQFAFGDGDGIKSRNLAIALDIVAHEFTHAVTQYESNLIYNGESGALNEAISDIFAATCESWHDGGINADTWKIGEDVFLSSKYIRRMNNPTLDGVSKDYYPDRYIGSEDEGGVHWNSGIANLAFYLLVSGGFHPRGLTTVKVPSIGMDKASKIFYYANCDYMTSGSDFNDAWFYTETSALNNYGSGEYNSLELANAVNNAWAAVSVPGASPNNFPLNIPSNLQVTNVTSTAIELTWIDNSRIEFGYKIEKNVNGGTFAEIGSVNPNVTHFRDSSVSIGNTYTYRVRAYNSGAYSFYSNEVNGVPENIIYVDKTNTGTEDGSRNHPYNTVTEGVDNAGNNGKVIIKTGVYNPGERKPLTISKPLSLSAEGGSATINP